MSKYQYTVYKVQLQIQCNIFFKKCAMLLLNHKSANVHFQCSDSNIKCSFNVSSLSLSITTWLSFTLTPHSPDRFTHSALGQLVLIENNRGFHHSSTLYPSGSSITPSMAQGWSLLISSSPPSHTLMQATGKAKRNAIA